MAKKESRGRQKIKMARIKNPSHRQVTFSKRRLGLFKKASEISTLCGVEGIIIVFSPGQKIFSFGHPNVESVVNRYLTRNSPPQTSSGKVKIEGGQVTQSSTMRELNSQLTKILDLLEAKRNRGEALNNTRMKFSQWWWEAPIEKLGLHELEVLGASMEDLKKNIASQAIYLEKTNSSSSMLSVINGSSSGVKVSDQHLDLKSIEVKIEGFVHADQVGNVKAPKLF